MKFEDIEIYGFRKALKGMRNPKESWSLSDSIEYWDDYYTGKHPEGKSLGNGMKIYIGPNDMKLAKTLIHGGSEHRKFLRQIFVSVDITAPLYWWKEFDTYKVGTVANSTSTMHKIDSKPITLDCFEIDDLKEDYILYQRDNNKYNVPLQIIEWLEYLRKKFKETKDKKYWKELIRWLPDSWLQTRTVTMTYENVLSMLLQRGNHKLNEWSGKDDSNFDNFQKFAYSLPYIKEFYDALK